LLVSKEIAILDPTVVVFFTGPDYDEFILKAFPGARLTPHPARPLRAMTRIAGTGLPDNSVRTYHPNHFWRNDIDRYLQDLIDWIRVP
jgi:hypothetical protein